MTWQPRFSHACLIANGENRDVHALHKLDRTAAHIIGIDGGANYLIAAGITPDAVMGDLDSVAGEFKNQIALPDQKQSDLEKSIVYLLARGVDHFTIYGALGGERIDHTIANLDLICKYAGHCRIAIMDRGVLIDGLSAQNTGPSGLDLPVTPQSIISVLAFGGTANITLRGTKYELMAADLEHGSHGVGNTALGDTVHIQIHQGCAWLTRTAPEA